MGGANVSVKLWSFGITQAIDTLLSMHRLSPKVVQGMENYPVTSLRYQTASQWQDDKRL